MHMFSKRALITFHFISYSRKITCNDILLGIPTKKCFSQETSDPGDSMIKELGVLGGGRGLDFFFYQYLIWSVSDPYVPGQIAYLVQ